MRPILRYPGAKWQIAPWIVSHLPKSTHFVEPYFGSGAVFFNLDWAPTHVVLNDLSGDVVNLFRVIRERGAELAALIEMTPWAREEYEASYVPCEDAMERARRFMVRSWQSHGSMQRSGPASWAFSENPPGNDGIGGYTHRAHPWLRMPDSIRAATARLCAAPSEIEHRPAIDIIKRYCSTEILIYADPPYPSSTRSGALYQHEMTDADHLALLDALDAHPGPVVLSGYGCALYDDRLPHWHRVTKQTQAEKGQTRTEVLWLNDAARPRTLFNMEDH